MRPVPKQLVLALSCQAGISEMLPAVSLDYAAFQTGAARQVDSTCTR